MRPSILIMLATGPYSVSRQFSVYPVTPSTVFRRISNHFSERLDSEENRLNDDISPE
jgi:hypothetical protein